LAGAVAAQAGPGADTVPPDSYADGATEALIARARAARLQKVEGIDSYEGKLRQRIYVGLTAARFRRERGLFEHERIARIRWTAAGDQVIQWLGVRTAIPIAGIDTNNPDGPSVRASVSDSAATVQAGGELAQDMAEDLLDETEMPGFDFDPGGDRLNFGGDDWALHPLSDSAAWSYRFLPGDTLTIDLPANETDITLYEVRVEPRRADFHLVAGSLWFDAASASLVRATYKPARPFNLAVDEPGDAEDVPGFMQPITAEIEFVNVEYSLQELKYWLPRRFAFEGEARIGSLFRIPITLEWNVSGYRVNEARTDLLVDGPLPEGWKRQVNVEEDDDGNEHRVVVIVPTVEELRESPELSEDFGERSPTAFSDTEVRELADQLEGLLPTYGRYRPQIAWGMREGLVRYNRVEGISVGSSATIPLSPRFEWRTRARIGSGDQVVNLTSGLRLGPESSRWSVEGYHRLQSMSDHGNPFDLLHSLRNLVLGKDRGEYYRATGASIDYQRRGDRVRFGVGAFHERQKPVALGEDFSLRGVVEDLPTPLVLPADPLTETGARLSLGWFAGLDPSRLIVTARMDAEVAGGDAQYQRLSGAISASHPLPFGLAGAVEAGGGTLWGDTPLQRSFFIGGSSTLRAFHRNQLHGPSYWRGRAELATGLAAARIGLFGDAAWVGEREDFTFNDPYLSVGVGASLLDGLFRADLARAVRGGNQWKLHLYLDGLF
jgi:Omp85 superfamily domain